MLEELTKGLEFISVGAMGVFALGTIYNIDTHLTNWYYHTYAMHKNTPFAQEHWKYVEKIKSKVDLSAPKRVAVKELVKLELTSFPTFIAAYRNIGRLVGSADH